MKIDFNNKSHGNIVDVEWDFGDGERSLSYHPTHTYKTPGTYVVTLSVSGPYAWHIATKEIRVTTGRRGG